jgi:sugar phosphate isomerase/epimerase
LESQLSAEDHIALMDRVGSPAIQVYYDVGNSQKNGYDILKEIRLLNKRIAQIHAKDTDDLYGKGSMDFRAVKKAMEDIGYKGWLVMEGTKMTLGVEASNRTDAEYLRTLFPLE